MSVNSVEKDAVAGLWKECDPPCLSLFQPTHRSHPDNQQDSIRFRVGGEVVVVPTERMPAGTGIAAIYRY